MENTISSKRAGNSVTGKVALDDPAIGIPDLLVVLYDVDPDTRPEESIAAASFDTTVESGLNALGDRIGSVLTAQDGSFGLVYDDSEFRIRNQGEKRPDLLLLVLAPEAPGKTLKDLVLYTAPEVRQNAGRIESYFVVLTAEALKKAGLPVPAAPAAPSAPTGDDDLALLEQKLKAGRRFFDRKAEILH
ncbi:MAG TPA: hypothetical protein VNS31_01030, partial [Ramlibacter sp.]|nr:hypothetical protein [Ramlibacter sp.]